MASWTGSVVIMECLSFPGCAGSVGALKMNANFEALELMPEQILTSFGAQEGAEKPSESSDQWNRW